MHFAPKDILLKDGRTALLRSPVPSDAAAFLNYLKLTASETPFLLRSPEEITMTVAEEEKYLQQIPESRVAIVCILDGKFAGNCQIDRRTKQKNRHRASIGIALLQEFWNLGIGTIMIEEMISIAESWGIRQLELEVNEYNQRAIGLYRKMGFETVSFVPDAVRMPDGSFAREILMIKTLKK